MRTRYVLFPLLFICLNCFAQKSYDLVIIGGNPGGIMAAISAARMGKTSVILERTAYIGGLPANGLGATDIATRAATTGLFREFVDRIKQHYIDTYGENAEQVKVCSDGYHFEPSVGAKVFDEMLGEYKDKITVLTMRQFDADEGNIRIDNDRIQAIRVLNRTSGEQEEYRGSVFLDATYEGDLGAAAGIPFRVGREGKSEFNEPGAGRVYKYWAGKEGSGSTFDADNAVQAYNYRLCLTNNPKNRVDITKPKNYNREEYAYMIEDVWTGNHTQWQMETVTPEMMEENRKHIKAGNPTKIPGDVWGIAKITNIVHVPNKKTDANNQHATFLSTDLPEENWAWPTSSWEWRDKFAQRLREYIEGLFWFAQNDSELPSHFRKAAKEWGLAKDEYTDNGNFPRQVYVREGRRFEGLYFFTANDALPVTTGARPPIHASSITASHYALDSHAVRKREKGRVHLDGFLSYPSAVYTVPYGVIVPKEIDNLLLPVPVSGSHIGFSTLRMEPCWMALGEAAGIASAIAIDKEVKMRNVPIEDLQEQLISQKATLYYFKDVEYTHPDFKMVEVLGLKGYLPEWEARLQDPVDKETLSQWKRLSNLKLEEVEVNKTTRSAVLRMIYQKTAE
ncbi:FAD-dependent oxidoreductase [Massilibacteroides sp.]|uniref:FAD-dependent oxidoreductase n=1 Tax=Massilibacteroides sp. TaxID=2034766 RepID=UPI00262D067C|nr:FAD-dependent oxidoreductase [Massilibacteroides sp.]MDD4514638.1 FAD-dependent oxidoreductase [Massilibacteroides sp.]